MEFWSRRPGLIKQNGVSGAGVTQLQRANKSNCSLSADCRAHLRFSACFHRHEVTGVTIRILWTPDKNAEEGADNSQTPGQMLFTVSPIRQMTQVTCDAPPAEKLDSWTEERWGSSCGSHAAEPVQKCLDSALIKHRQVWLPQKTWEWASRVYN